MYCSNNVDDYLPTSLQPEEIRTNDEDFIRTVQAAIDSENEALTRSVFRFDWTTEAATHNHKVLAAVNFDINKIIKSKNKTVSSPGSEFRPIEILDTFMSKHPNWVKV